MKLLDQKIWILDVSLGTCYQTAFQKAALTLSITALKHNPGGCELLNRQSPLASGTLWNPERATEHQSGSACHGQRSWPLPTPDPRCEFCGQNIKACSPAVLPIALSLGWVAPNSLQPQPGGSLVHQ